mmetsp:Transcript_14144/g.32276  ORF Transcript_14144/g.32276 Transcript_14144/m.32276 type:complete len:276 (-) Transcript_14144:350-1177(-)
MRQCIRRCVVSIYAFVAPAEAAEGNAGIARSRSETASPPLAASALTTGLSCCGSPKSTARRARSSGSHEFGCDACEASSSSTVSKECSSRTAASPAAVVVHSTTFASARASCSPSVMRLASTRRMRRRKKEAICDLRSRPIFRFSESSESSRFSSRPTSPLSLDMRRAATSSGVSSRARTSMRSGLPTRTSRSSGCACSSRRARRSTAKLDGAHTRRRSPRATDRRTTSTNTEVLPVPGGPKMMPNARSCSRAKATAVCCASSRCSVQAAAMLAS